MSDVRSGAHVAWWARVAVAVFAVAALTACQPPARDMPVVVVPEADGSVRMLYPLCADQSVRSILVVLDPEGSGSAVWYVDAGPDAVVSRDRVGELTFGPDGFDPAGQVPGVARLSDKANTPIDTGFFSLRVIDFYVGDGEAIVRPGWFPHEDRTQWFLNEEPWKQADVEVEVITEDEGRARLLQWCNA